MPDKIVNAQEYANLTHDVLEALDEAGYKVVKKNEEPEIGDTRLIFQPTGDGKWFWKVEEYISHMNLEFWTQAYDSYDVFKEMRGKSRKRHVALWKGIRALHNLRAQKMLTRVQNNHSQTGQQIFS